MIISKASGLRQPRNLWDLIASSRQLRSSVSQICVSIFDLQNFYAFSVSGNIGLGSGASLSTGFYALPANSVSLVGSLAAVSSLTYNAGSGYTKNSNAATPCGGEHDYSTATISTNGPASLSSSSQSYLWFEQGITLESSVPTTTSSSSTSTTPNVIFDNSYYNGFHINVHNNVNVDNDPHDLNIYESFHQQHNKHE